MKFIVCTQVEAKNQIYINIDTIEAMYSSKKYCVDCTVIVSSNDEYYCIEPIEKVLDALYTAKYGTAFTTYCEED